MLAYIFFDKNVGLYDFYISVYIFFSLLMIVVIFLSFLTVHINILLMQSLYYLLKILELLIIYQIKASKSDILLVFLSNAYALELNSIFV